MSSKEIYLIAGGNGFIGSHVAKALTKEGRYVRIADINPKSCFDETICSEMMLGNLCDPSFCSRATRNVHTIFHFAATMGGMGTIHKENDFVIYKENSTMTLELLNAARRAEVKLFFYASSACVYPASLQDIGQNEISLRETDVWSNPPPHPQGFYGLEKLVSEFLIQNNTSPNMQIRIARFHNVYGPRGAWYNGREKAPAALLRKAIAASLNGERAPSLEIWGDGQQRRSFLFIDDCVDAILRLLVKDFKEPLNIGSDESVTIERLAEISIKCAGIRSDAVVDMLVFKQGPLGVASRNSNNDLVKTTLDWTPRTSLENGMQITASWMRGEMENEIGGLDIAARNAVLDGFRSSELVYLEKDSITFAILLPITSRGLSSPSECLDHLRSFSKSLARTSWRDTHQSGGTRYRIKVYLALDKVDTFLLQKDTGGDNIAHAVLLSEGIEDVTIIQCDFPEGHVCSIWRKCARRAWDDGCHYQVLMGDDVILRDEGWIRDVHAEFGSIAEGHGVPGGFGCVAFTDTTFPGMPTFPIIHRIHMDIFDGEVIPDVFVNQDGDPFLFQLYRRWGCSRMLPCRISNTVGGSGKARYRQQRTSGWTFKPLDAATSTAEKWLREHYPNVKRKLTIDVIIPCYRVQLPFLEPMLALQPSPTCTVMFIVIIDNPLSPNIFELKLKYGHRPDVRIRVNSTNIGASASRNRGMEESAAEWVAFLDDDVTPKPDLLIEAEKVICSHPLVAGFVGNVKFPPATTIFTNAVHLAGVTHFWDIATKIKEDLPWGVTANIIARRIQDGIEFDLQFPKTGGGEDIDFCRKKRDYSLSQGGEGFYAAPDVEVTHPWWNSGRRSYWRYYMWSKGDGRLVKLYPEHTYLDAPNSAELLLTTAILCGIGLFVSLAFDDSSVLLTAMKFALSIVIANTTHDMYRHLWRDVQRTRDINSTASKIQWVLAVIESSFIRMSSEAGRVLGMVERGELLLLGRRFDWFLGRAGVGPRNEERINSQQRLGMALVILFVLLLI